LQLTVMQYGAGRWRLLVVLAAEDGRRSGRAQVPRRAALHL
jgi:hypothetical protein